MYGPSGICVGDAPRAELAVLVCSGCKLQAFVPEADWAGRPSRWGLTMKAKIDQAVVISQGLSVRVKKDRHICASAAASSLRAWPAVSSPLDACAAPRGASKSCGRYEQFILDPVMSHQHLSTSPAQSRK